MCDNFIRLGLTEEEYNFAKKVQKEVDNAIKYVLEHFWLGASTSDPIGFPTEEDDDDEACGDGFLDRLDLTEGFDVNSWDFDEDEEPTRRIELDCYPRKEEKCECGAEKVGSTIHSSYCPKYKKEQI